MNPELFARLKEIFLTFPRLPESERQDYLAEVCGGDTDLRQQVDSIFTRSAEVPELLRTGAMAELYESCFGTIAQPPGTGSVPEKVGPYKILGILGEGGMGVVYRALQTEPIRREVALKLIKRGMDTDQVVARFEAERQALAMMDHPNIATVLDAGTDDSGRPYFVMELARGIPLNNYCDQNHLDIQSRLRVFLFVCRAVQHAHQNGIAHRDLKPSNILVTSRDGEPSPKIIDFGIAKAVDERGSRRTLLTQEGQLIGTPEYMSPEQAFGDPREIDLRTDIYSLGVILYELLAGELPYDTKGTSIVDVARVIREEPVKRLRRTGTTTGRIDPDVETIVLKALEKEPDRRYYSASMFGEDIERYLTSQPILARPPSTIYQFRKLVGRHRVLFGFVSAIIVLLLVFGVAMSFMFERQRREHLRAEGEAEKAAQINTFLGDMLGSVAPDEMGREVTVREVLDRSAASIDESFADNPEVRAAIQYTIGKTYQRLRLDEEAEPHLRASLATSQELHGLMHDEVATALEDLAELLEEKLSFDESDSLTRLAIHIRRTLHGDRDATVARAVHQLASIADRRDNKHAAEAESLFREALAIREEALGDTAQDVGSSLNDLAVFLFFHRRYDEAEPLYRRAIEIRRTGYGDDHPDIATMTDNLALLLTHCGKQLEAEPLQRQSLEVRKRQLGDEHPMIAIGLCNLAITLECQEKYAEAESLMRESLRVCRACDGDDHIRTCTAREGLARILMVQGNYSEAEDLYQESIRSRERVFGEWGKGVPWARVWLAWLWLETGRAEQAEPIVREIRDQWEENMTEYTWMLGFAENTLGRCLAGLGRPDEARPLLKRSRPYLETVYLQARRPLLERTADLYRAWGEPAEADLYLSMLP